MASPHYLPEVASRVTLLNFCITREGLEQHLLSVLVATECPDLEADRNSLRAQGAAMAKEIEVLEERVLRLLSTASGNILDDDALISTLSESKIKSTEVAKAHAIAAEKERENDATRERYRPTARLAACVYFAVSAVRPQVAHVPNGRKWRRRSCLLHPMTLTQVTATLL